ncbi:hypothetical protein M434DRAFT_256936 [Hypoxylon sp. CO27-5]|nr:hypothetical protein M434DRAFT_256936 [Hypoxylon sp. CO27-5]
MSNNDGHATDPALREMPPSEITVPRIPARADIVSESWKKRIESNGTWFLKDLSFSSRYYARNPRDRGFHSAGDQDEPIDVVLLVKDVQKYTSQEDLVEEITRQLSEQTEEYSRDFVPETGKHRRLHTNEPGREFLLDFDTLIEEIRKLEYEVRKNAQDNAAKNIFNAVCEAYNWDPQKVRDTGFHHDLIYYGCYYFASRLRFMRDVLLRDRPPSRGGQERGVPPILNNISWEFSNRSHAPDLRGDLRVVEWYSDWAQHFSMRQSDQWTTDPRLKRDDINTMFENVYGFHPSIGWFLCKLPMPPNFFVIKTHPIELLFSN